MRTGNTEFERVEMCDTEGNTFVTRSGFEARWAEYLHILYRAGEINGFEYEPKEFKFKTKDGKNIQRGRGAFYRPDFWVFEGDGNSGYFVECKGHLDQISKTKIMRFLKQYEKTEAQRFQLVLQSVPKKGKSAIDLDDLRNLIENVNGRIIDAKECLRNIKF